MRPMWALLLQTHVATHRHNSLQQFNAESANTLHVLVMRDVLSLCDERVCRNSAHMMGLLLLARYQSCWYLLLIPPLLLPPPTTTRFTTDFISNLHCIISPKFNPMWLFYSHHSQKSKFFHQNFEKVLYSIKLPDLIFSSIEKFWLDNLIEQ